MIIAQIRHDMGKFLSKNKDLTLLGGYQATNMERCQESMRNQLEWREVFVVKFKTIKEYVVALREVRKSTHAFS